MKKSAVKILLIEIVEDEVPVREALSDKFEHEGFSVIKAQDGREGLRQALEHKPSIILLDLLMPQMDGISMLKKLREDDWGRTVPVIVLTNVNETQKVAESLESGAYDFLVKADWTLEAIVEKVKERLGVK